jgi:hypothetical protein
VGQVRDVVGPAGHADLAQLRGPVAPAGGVDDHRELEAAVGLPDLGQHLLQRQVIARGVAEVDFAVDHEHLLRLEPPVPAGVFGRAIVGRGVRRGVRRLPGGVRRVRHGDGAGRADVWREVQPPVRMADDRDDRLLDCQRLDDELLLHRRGQGNLGAHAADRQQRRGPVVAGDGDALRLDGAGEQRDVELFERDLGTEHRGQPLLHRLLEQSHAGIVGGAGAAGARDGCSGT